MVPADFVDPALVARLAEAARAFDATASDLERNCWMAVHQHIHGVLPSEYDIRDIDEALFLAVLALRRAETAGGVDDLG
ncbi:MAG: hypothetical protein RLZZ468_571 [Cyanobacteriota bacterium]|jgi:hypothetical protein